MLKLAVSHQQAGRSAEAEQIYRQILEEQPNHPDALHLSGVMASQAGRYEEACELIGRAIAQSPANASYHRNMGTALRHRGMVDQAIAAWQQAIEIKPNTPDLLNSLGTALQEKGNKAEALDCFRRAISFSPEYAHAHYNLGCLLEEKGESDQAIACYKKVLELKPEYSEANNNLGRVYKDQGRLDDAIACYRRAWELNPSYLDAAQSLQFILLYHPNSTPQSLAAELAKWNEVFGKPLAQFIQPHSNDRDPNRRLRIGYVSADFRAHVVARFYIYNLLAQRKRDQFEVFCYAQVPVHDEMTTRLKEMSDHWQTVVAMTDAQLAGQIREDRIDILIDLALHTAGNRLLVFARKPAPLQMTLAGYPGSTGLETIDCRLTDPYLDPPGASDEFYSEKSERMPDTFWCHEEMEREPAVNPLPALSNGYVTFGSLNNFCKVNEMLLSQWAGVLNGLSDSRLLLLAPAGEPRQRVQRFLGERGIHPGRVEFVGMQSRLDYLATYNRIDIGLDTWPYNGHSTSVDSFWMGVPVVTWVGPTVVGRAGVSQLINLNLVDLIGQTGEEFVEIAIRLANDLPRLAELRATLRVRIRRSPLMNTRRFVRGIERIYRRKWKLWADNSKSESSKGSNE